MDLPVKVTLMNFDVDFMLVENSIWQKEEGEIKE